MSSKDDLIKELRLAIIVGDEERAREAAKRCLEAGVDPMEAVEHGLRDGLRIVGEKFERLEVFLPEMMMAARAASRVPGVARPYLPGTGEARKVTATTGPVKGGVHDIGKNIVATILERAGFRVVDLCTDVLAERSVRAVNESGAAVGVSALLSAALPRLEQTVREIIR